MNINKYIYDLAKQIRESRDATERNALRVKLDYARAHQNGALESFRDRAIEREIGKTYTVGAQLAFLFNKDIHTDEYADYQAFRAKCKAKVDADMSVLSWELNEALRHI